jgi:hypothetical protein
MENVLDLDAIVTTRSEEKPVVPAAQPEILSGRLQLLYIADSTGQIPVQAVENLHRRFTVDVS